jgi:putative transposase
MSRYRLAPTLAQAAVMQNHCAHARFVWNLAVEQQSHWRPGRTCAPGYLEQCRQLTLARAEHVRRLSRKTAEVWIPKAGWVRFRWSREVPEGVKSYRVILDRAGRWHIAFAAIPKPIPSPGTGHVVGIDRDVTISAALSTGEMLTVPRLSSAQQCRLRRLQRKLAKAGFNREILRAGWGLLVRRLEDKAPDRVEKVRPHSPAKDARHAGTSQRAAARAKPCSAA